MCALLAWLELSMCNLLAWIELSMCSQGWDGFGKVGKVEEHNTGWRRISEIMYESTVTSIGLLVTF